MTDGTSGTVALQLVSGDDGFVTAHVRADPSADHPVAFELVVRNVSGGAVTVTNPYEGTSYHLINSAGVPVQTKAPPRQAKVHATADPAQKLAYLGVTAATVAGNAVSVDELVGTQEFELTADGEVRMSLAVTASIDPSDRSTLDHVPAGRHSLVVLLRVVVIAADRRHPVLLRTSQDLVIDVE